MTEIVIERATSTCGAYFEGIDMTVPPSDEVRDTLAKALHEHGVLFFRNQPLTPAQQVAFAAPFGRLHIHPYVENLGPEHPEIIVLNECARGTVQWHSDSLWEEYPPLGSILRAMTIPSVGGDTLWTSMYAAYDALSRAMQAFLGGLHATHGGEKIARLINRGPGNESKVALS